jgi:hypothetical protein
MPQPAAARTVAYTFTETEAIAYSELISKREARNMRRAWLSQVYMPVLLLAVLMAIATLAGANPVPILAVATIAYLCGDLTLRYEIEREYRRLAATLRRTDPMYQWERHLTLGESTVEVKLPHISIRYDYAAFTDFEISRGLILGWVGSGTVLPVPVRAFVSEGEASAFANDFRSRIAAARPGATKG